MKQTLAVWGDNFNQIEEGDDQDNTSWLVSNKVPSIFEPMYELMDIRWRKRVSFLDIQKNLRDYSHNELRSLASVLSNAYYDFIKEKESLRYNLVEISAKKPIMSNKVLRKY